jgi:hypothetical protein
LPIETHLPNNANLAFWLAPIVSTIPLIPFFSLPSSPLFLGRLMGDSTTNPFLQPQLGPWLAAAAVVFDGSVLAYLVAVFIYLPLLGSGRIHWDFFNAAGKLSLKRVLILFSLAGVSASQFVHWAQDFREPALREFAVSWLSPLFGCLCGLISGACFAFVANRRFSPGARVLVYSMPVTIVVACGGILFWSSKVMPVH